MMKLHILTTATPRTDLHRKTLEPALEVLSKCFDVHLYINLDDVLGEDAFQESMEFIETLPTKQTHLMPSKTGSFKLAAKRLYEAVKLPDEDDLFLWLEDDWVLERPDDFVEELKSFSDSGYDFIVTTIYDYIGGNPLVFRKEFFDQMQEHYLDNTFPMDPERVLWHIEQAIWGGQHGSNCKFLEGTFVDVGREWRADRGIEKENKRSDVLETWHFS